MLGKGGFAKVYRARDEELNRDVAIKIPHLNPVNLDAEGNLFLKEAQTLATLTHPSIASVYDVGWMRDGRFYLITQLIEQGNLAERTKGEKLPIQRALKIVIAIAEALHYAHDQGCIHRDVKPSNILLDSNDKPWLVDFGLALRDADVGRKFMEYAGSRHYMSPEQISGKGHLVDRRADVYSLGVVLYQLITGRKPFEEENSEQLAHQILNLAPVCPSDLDRQVSQSLDKICLKALSKAPEDRHASAAEFANELETCLLGQHLEGLSKLSN